MSEEVNYGEYSKNSNCDNVKQYTKYLDVHGGCTREENDELVQAARSGDAQAQHRLIMGNAGMAISVARKFRHLNHVMSFEDVVQSAMEEMIILIAKFDPDKGYALSTYVYRSLLRRVGREISQRYTEIRLPVHMATFCTKVAQVCASLEARGVDRTIQNIITSLNARYDQDLAETTNRVPATERHVRNALGIILWQRDSGEEMVQFGGEDGGKVSLFDLIPDEVNVFEAMEAKIDADRLRKHLLPAQQLSIELRFMHDASLQDIAEVTGTSRQNEDQRLRNALKKIRRKEGIPEPELSERSKAAQARMARDKANGVVLFNGKRCHG